jgi:hypothetical protein
VNHQADSAPLRWLMLPAAYADSGHLPDLRAQDCARALRLASQRLHSPLHDVRALRSGDVADLASWLRRDLAILRWGLYLAGAWVYASKLRMQAGQAATAGLTHTLGARQLLAVLRGNDPYPGSLPTLRDAGQVLAAGGALMSVHCGRYTPMLADRLLQGFPSNESAAWCEAPQIHDEAWRERVVARVLQAQPETAP